MCITQLWVILLSMQAVYVESQSDTRMEMKEACIQCISKGFSLNVPDNECKKHINVTYCGRWALSSVYFQDCSWSNKAEPLSKSVYEECATDVACARTCVRNYLSRYKRTCMLALNKEDLDCADYASVHAGGGPNGCRMKKEENIDVLDYIHNMSNFCPDLVEKQFKDFKVEDVDNLLYMIVGSVVGVIILIVIILLTVFLVRRKQILTIQKPRSAIGINVMQYLTRPETGDDVKELLEHFRVPKSQVGIHHHIGNGHFGKIYKGSLSQNEEEITVAIKTLRDAAANENEIEAFLKEAVVMSGFDHLNVLKLIGICWELNELPLMILPFMERGDLQTLVQDKEKQYSVGDLINFCIQIGDGMAYLTSERFVHRDLAARNCLVNDCFLVKIADFGLSRDVYERNYYTVDGSKTALPWKWMAIESIQHGRYTSQSDVWSFGILMWELFTSGSSPYPAISNLTELDENLSAGYRLTRPDTCPDDLFLLMDSCWYTEPSDRPTFTEIVSKLREHLAIFENDAGYSYTVKFGVDIGPLFPRYVNEMSLQAESELIRKNQRISVADDYLYPPNLRSDFIEEEQKTAASKPKDPTKPDIIVDIEKQERHSKTIPNDYCEASPTAIAAVATAENTKESSATDYIDKDGCDSCEYLIVYSDNEPLPSAAEENVSDAEPDYLNAETLRGMLPLESVNRPVRSFTPIPQPRKFSRES